MLTVPQSQSSHALSRSVLIAALILCALAPIAYIVSLIYRFGVNAPVWDEWETATLLISAKSGALSLHDLNRQQNEHRLFFPNLIFIGLSEINGWNPKYEMYGCAFLASLSSIGMCILFRITSKLPASSVCLAAVLFNLLIFSPIHSETWLTGLYLTQYLAELCLIAGVLSMHLPLPPITKILTCAALCTIGTFSFGHGFNGWIVLSLLIMFFLHRELKQNYVLPVIWISAFSLNLWFYLRGYQKPIGHPPLSTCLHAPIQAIQFFCMLLGSPFGLAFGSAAIWVSTLMGAIILSLFIFLLGWKILAGVRAKSWEMARSSAGWIAIGLFGLLTAAIITVSRAGFGPLQALEIRYMQITLPVTLSVCALLFIHAFGARSQGGRTSKYASLLFLSGIAVLMMNALPEGIQRMADLRRSRQRGMAYLEFINIVPCDDILKTSVYPKMAQLRERANALDKIGILNPRLIRTSDVTNLALTEGVCEKCGELYKPEYTQDGGVILTGWAELPYRKEPADLVLICRQQKGSTPEVIALAEVAARPSGNRGAHGHASAHNWSCMLSNVHFDAEGAISAWAFDCYSYKAMRLSEDSRQ